MEGKIYPKVDTLLKKRNNPAEEKLEKSLLISNFCANSIVWLKIRGR